MRIVDANLLIYAFDKDAPQHAMAKSWLEDVYSRDDLVGLPRLVLLAFLRITTNPRIMNTPIKTEIAMEIVENLVAHAKTVVVDCGPNHWKVFKDLVVRSCTGPQSPMRFWHRLRLSTGRPCAHVMQASAATLN